MAGLVEGLLVINASAYSFEPANARHEHEWKVRRDVFGLLVLAFAEIVMRI
jgi:hypothetical protein